MTENVRKELENFPNISFTPLDEAPPGAEAAFMVEYEL